MLTGAHSTFRPEAQTQPQNSIARRRYWPRNMLTESAPDLRTYALRIGLLSAGLVFFNIALGLWQAQAFVYAANIGLSFLACAAGAVSMVVAFIPVVDKRWSWLVLVSAIALALQFAYIEAQTYAPLTASHTDNEMIAKYAVEALKHGQNPYSWNFADMLRVYRDQGNNMTALLDGSSQNR